MSSSLCFRHFFPSVPPCLESPDPRYLPLRLLSLFTSLVKGHLLEKPELTPLGLLF